MAVVAAVIERASPGADERGRAAIVRAKFRLIVWLYFRVYRVRGYNLQIGGKNFRCGIRRLEKLLAAEGLTSVSLGSPGSPARRTQSSSEHFNVHTRGRLNDLKTSMQLKHLHRGAQVRLLGKRRYFSMTPHATRSPELPDGSDMRSSALAWMTRDVPPS
jgi:hypothetical protein